MKIRICLMFFAVLFFSCSSHSIRDYAKLQALDEMIENQSGCVLDSLKLINPEKLKRGDKAYYYLLQADAKEKKYGQEQNDSILLKIKGYFEDKGDYANLARTEYLLGACLFRTNDKENSFVALKDAENHLKKSKKENLPLLGRIYYWMGQIQNKQMNLLEAKAYFKKSFDVFSQAKDSISMVHALRQIGGIYCELENYLDAQKNFENSMAIVQQIKVGDKEQLIDIEASIEGQNCRFYLRTKSYDKALQAGKNSISLLESHQMRVLSQYYLNVIRVLKKSSRIDSIKYYCQKMIAVAEKENNYFNLTNGYQTLYELEEMQGNFQAACKLRDIHNQLKDEQNKQNRAEVLLEFDKKYRLAEKDKEILRNANRNLWQWLISLVVVSVLAVYFGTIHRRLKGKYMSLSEKVKHAKWGLELSKSLLTDNYDVYDELEHLMNRHKVNLKMPALYDEFQLLAQKQKEEYVNRIYNSLVNIDNEFILRIKVRYPGLEIEEMMLAAMLLRQWSLNAIGEVLRVKREALKKRILRLKAKLATPNISDGDFQKILEQI